MGFVNLDEDVEFEDLSEEVKWEAQRHAVALGLPRWDVIGYDNEEGGHRLCFRAETEGLWVECWFGMDEEEKNDWGLQIDDYGGGSGVYNEDDMFVELIASTDEVVCQAHLPPAKKNKADEVTTQLLKAAYLLGHPIDAFEIELGLTLSHHEKLELRLSFPRELWPKTWLEEEASPDKGTKRSST